MNKKNTKNPSDPQPPYKYNRVFVNEQKSTTNPTSSNFKSQKIAQYTSPDRLKLPSPESTLNQKSHIQQESKQSESKVSKQGHRQIVRKEQPQTNNSRSKSKQKKDRLTLNLAKFARKPTDKVKSPSNKEKAVESIYLERGENLVEAETYSQQQSQYSSQPKEEAHEKVANVSKSNIQKSQNNNHKSFFSQDFQSIISDNRAANNPTPINEDVKTKVETSRRQPQPQKYYQVEQKKEEPIKAPILKSSLLNSEKQIENNQPKEVRFASSHSINDRPIYEILRGQQNAAIQELTTKLKVQKQESGEAIKKLQTQKRQLQQKNRNFIQSQFKLKNQVQILKVKNVELIKQVQNIKQLYEVSETTKESQVKRREKTVLELEERYKRLLKDLQLKQQENGQLSLTVHQLDAKCGELQNRIKMFENQRRIKGRELQLVQKQNKNELEQLISAYDLKLKQWELKSNSTGVEQAKYKAMREDMEKEIQQLRKQLHLKQIQIEELSQSQRQFKSKDKERKLELENKYREIDNLVGQLNHNQEELLKQKMLHSQTVKKYETQLIRHQAQIQTLKEEINHIRAASSIEKMQNNASFSAFGSQKQEVNQQYKAFIDLQQRQTQETNALRQQLQLKGEQIHRLESENEDLKNRIRRVEQENELGGRTLTVNLNNLKQAKEANEIVLRSQVQSLKRKITSLEMRMKGKQNQIAEKNRFIKQFLMSDIQKREDASSLVKRLQQALNK